MFNNITILVVTSLMLIGCTTNDEKMDSWLGDDVNNVVTSWGTPGSTCETDDGGKIIKYSHSRIGGATPMERVLFPKRYYCDANFISNSNGKIIDAGAEGNLKGCNWLIKRNPIKREHRY